MSRSLAHTTLGAKANRQRASQDAKGVCALQGMRIHQLMDQLNQLDRLEGGQVGPDEELQSKLIELKRVLGGIDPLLDKVASKIERSGDTPTSNAELRATPDSTAEPQVDHETDLASDELHAAVEDGDTTADERDMPELLSDIDEGEASDHADEEVSMRYDAGPPHGVGDYVGHVQSDVPHGQGSMEWPSGKRYQGEWKNGKRHGQGWHMWTDGRTFDGQWKDGRPHGLGKWTSPRGESYDGRLVNGKKSGKGTFTYPDGKTYSGDWLNGMRHGQGTRLYPDGSIYVGSWTDDKRDGQGTYTWKDGRVWTGTWREGNPTKDAPHQSSDRDSHYRTNSEAPTLFGGSELDLTRSETSARSSVADTSSNSTLDPSRQAHSRKGSGSSRRSSHGGSPEGFPPTAPESRSKHAAAAIREMRELREFSTAVERFKKPIMLRGRGSEGAIERQGTASTLEGTVTGSEWGGLSDRGVDSATHSNSNNNSSNAKEQQKEGGLADPPAVESSAQLAKSKGLFGGAAEKIVQWGPKLLTVGRRSKDDSMSESQESFEGGSEPAATNLKNGELRRTENGSRTAPTSLSPSPRENGPATDGNSTARGHSRGHVDSGGNGHGHRSARDTSRRRQEEAEREANYGVGGSNFASDGAPVESRRSRGSTPASRIAGRTSSRERKRLVEETGSFSKDRRGGSGEVSSTSGRSSGRTSGRRERSSRDVVPEMVPKAPSSITSEGSRREGTSERDRRDASSRRGSRSSGSTDGSGSSSRRRRDTDSGRADGDSAPRRDSRSRGGGSRGPREEKGSSSRSGSSRSVTAPGDDGGRDKRHGKDRASSSRFVAVDQTRDLYGSGGGDALDRSEPSRGSNGSSSSRKHERRRSEGSGGREPSSVGREPRRSERPSSAGKRAVPELKFPLFSHHIREEGEVRVTGEAGGGAPPRSKSSRNILRGDGARETGGDGLGRSRTESRRSSSSRMSGERSGEVVVPDEPGQGYEAHRRQSNESKPRMVTMSYNTGVPHGLGEYVGEVKDNVPDGQGTIKWPNGNGYVGGWVRGERNGYGTFTWEGGRKQECPWVNGKAHGQGTLSYGDGISYVGGWVDGLKHGHGIRTYLGGGRYDGGWKWGLRHGNAVWSSPDGRFEGEYEDDQKNGQGTYVWADGRKHVGGWKDGKQHGQGTLYNADGKVTLQGKWRKGEKTLFF